VLAEPQNERLLVDVDPSLWFKRILLARATKVRRSTSSLAPHLATGRRRRGRWPNKERMKWLLIIVAIPVLVVCAFVVLVWITKPRKHRGVRYAVLSIVLRQLASPLHNGGTIYLEHADVEGTIQVRMRRYKTRPDQLLFRFRNADKTSPAFEQVVAALDRDKIPFDTELTKIRNGLPPVLWTPSLASQWALGGSHHGEETALL
jgi:hypothetical protein